MHRAVLLMWLACPAPPGAAGSMPDQPPLAASVTVMDLQTVRVDWNQSWSEGLEIVFSPRGASFYIVHPVHNPAARSLQLEGLLPFTFYQLVIRRVQRRVCQGPPEGPGGSPEPGQTDTLYFSTSEVTDEETIGLVAGRAMRPEEVGVVLLVLLFWGFAIQLFIQRWGKIRGLLPYQPVYQKALEASVGEAVKKLHTDSSYSCEWGSREVRVPHHPGRLGGARTNSAFMFKQPRSLEIDRNELRKTRSAENMNFPPQIVINQTSPAPRSTRRPATAAGTSLLAIPPLSATDSHQDSARVSAAAAALNRAFYPRTGGPGAGPGWRRRSLVVCRSAGDAPSSQRLGSSLETSQCPSLDEGRRRRLVKQHYVTESDQSVNRSAGRLVRQPSAAV